MSVSDLLRKNRSEKNITQGDLAKKLKVPVEVIAYLEDPSGQEEGLINLLAKAFDITPELFKGETTKEEIRREEVIKKAKFPKIREFILDPARCQNVEKAMELFGDEELSLAERNVILYLSTTALYHFCDTNTSSFAFDQYLFKMHGKLLSIYKQTLDTSNLSSDEKEERIGNARGNVFACDSMENIAIRVLGKFASEMEQKLANNQYDFNEDLGMPLVWDVNEDLMKIEIKDERGQVKDEIKLLDVKEKA